MKKIKIDKEKCIGCGLCAAIADEIFQLGDEGKAEVIEKCEECCHHCECEGVDEAKVQEAIDSCPTGAISWVEEDKEDKNE